MLTSVYALELPVNLFWKNLSLSFSLKYKFHILFTWKGYMKYI